MKKFLSRRSLRVPGAVLIAATMTLIAPLSAHAEPSPTHGPTAGGTTVTDTFPGLTFTSVSAGFMFTAAVGSDGHIYAWGSNDMGQLGRGFMGGSGPQPIQRVHTPAGVTFTAVQASTESSWATGSDGNTYAWGHNGVGQLGDGTTTDRSTPVVVDLPLGVTLTQLSGSDNHVFALGSDGVAYAWGGNGWGQLGDGTTIQRATPVPVLSPPGVSFTEISTGFYHSVAIGSDGLAYSWGSNIDGQLGDGELIVGVPRSLPGPVDIPTGLTVDSVSSGISSSIVHASDGNYYAWGDNEFGQLGDGTIGIDQPIPVLVNTPSGVTITQLRMGGYHTAALGADGTAWGWGDNRSNQLGVVTFSDGSPVPVRTPLPNGVTFLEVSLLTDNSRAVGSDGNLYLWGDALARSPWLMPAATTVTAVTFDGIPGTNLSYDGNNWSVESPAHDCGSAIVTVEYSQLGLDESFIWPNGFTYGSPASILSQPASATITAGSEFSTSIVVTGDTAPAIQWQELAGSTWKDLVGQSQSMLSTIPTDSTSYRAVVTNCFGSVTSDTAVATLSPAAIIEPGTGNPSGTGGLAKTGSELAPLVLFGLGLFTAGMVLVASRMRARSRKS